MTKKRGKINNTKIVYFVLGTFLIGLFLFFSYSRIFDEFEYNTLDLRYRLRPSVDVDKNIVIIEIGDDSIEKIGKWPFPRKYHSLLVKALNSADVDTIIFDIFFSESKEGDEEFVEAINDIGKVYLPYVFEPDRDKKNIKHLYASKYAASLIDGLSSAAKGTGFINVEPDIDGKIRKIPLYIEYENKFYPHISVLAALNNLGYDFDYDKVVPGKKMVVNENLVIPLGEDSSVLINYPDVWGKAFRHYSYIDILQSYTSDLTGQEPAVDLNELKGAICFIGLTATASPDAHPSPLESLYPGVGVHTSIYNSIIHKNFLRRLNRWWNLLILMLMWIITVCVTEKSRKRFALFSIVLIMAVYIFLAILLFGTFGIWIDVFYPLITIAAVYIIATFIKYITEIQKRELIEKELDIAKNIQQSFLPEEIPNFGDVDISIKMITARQIGGDLYDIIKLDDDKIGIMIGDVSGKGVPAALYMARVVSLFKTFADKGTPVDVLKKVNEGLSGGSRSNLFVTLTYIVFNTQEKSVTFAVGGHMPTILVEPDGEIKFLDVDQGMPLGIIEGEFTLGQYKYKPGSTFILYTDGVTEAMNTKEEMFEEDRLVKLAKELKGMPADDIVAAIHKAVSDFAGKAKQFDDITVIAIKV